MISRRALLGTLVGLPLGVKAAMAKSPTIGDINVTAIPTTGTLTYSPTIQGISRQRIIDIADMYLHETLWGLHNEGVCRSHTPQPQGSDCLYIPKLVPYSYFKQQMSTIINNCFAGTHFGVAQSLAIYDDKKATLCGVQCYPMEAGSVDWTPEGGIVYNMLAVQTAEKPDKQPPCIYTQWRDIIE